MIRLGKRQQSIIIALAVLFLLGRVMGLHAHGHVELSHDHDVGTAMSHQHDDASEKTHLVSHLGDSQDSFDEHGADHGEKTFDIQIPSIVKKQNSNLDLSLLFLLSVFILTWFSSRSLLSVNVFQETATPLSDKLYLIHQPLRAPPTLV